VRAVKEHGGLTLAQAEFHQHAKIGMPSSAAATGLVDFVLPVEDMPARLMSYWSHLSGIEDRKGPDGARQDMAETVPKISGLLRRALGHDFSEYKQNTVVRRIQRRMQVLQIGNPADYAMPGRRAGPKVQIFATDIDEHAIATARAGRYRKSLLSGVSEEQRKQWFVKEDDHYCPIKSIRETCVFSMHSVIKDPPFSKLDLIVCRNLMIYLNPALQEKVLRTFHYALRANGVLFLGNSESIGRQTSLLRHCR
jgi:chemotaxis methyl-accepting protein methylase